MPNHNLLKLPAENPDSQAEPRQAHFIDLWRPLVAKIRTWIKWAETELARIWRKKKITLNKFKRFSWKFYGTRHNFTTWHFRKKMRHSFPEHWKAQISFNGRGYLTIISLNITDRTFWTLAPPRKIQLQATCRFWSRFRRVKRLNRKQHTSPSLGDYNIVYSYGVPVNPSLL